MGKEIIEFEQHVERGCEMDVHKETVVATVSGQGIKTETRTFSTITSSLKNDDLRKLINGFCDFS